LEKIEKEDMNSALIFALLAGMSIGLYSFFQKLGSTNINPALGSMVVSAVAFTINLVILLSMKIRNQEILFTNKGLKLLILVGIAAAGIDFFSLLAYSRGLRLTSSFIIGGVQTAIVLTGGYLVLKEPFDLARLFALALIIIGTFLLQRFGV